MTCAAGAMLFGGTLGVAQEAQAGLTWTQLGSFAYNYAGGPTISQSLASAGTPVTTGGSNFVAFSAATSTGWSITGSNAGGDTFNASVSNEFTVTATTVVSISGIGFGGSGYIGLYNYSLGAPKIWSSETAPDSSVGVSGAFSSGPITLQAGTYALQGIIYPSGVFGSSTLFEIAVVPAPGAIALLGAAGFVARRRRSN
jgi:hypothetical protein